MLKVCTTKSVPDGGFEGKARCPHCGKMLFGIKYINGASILQLRCPRCKSYVDIDLSGIAE